MNFQKSTETQETLDFSDCTRLGSFDNCFNLFRTHFYSILGYHMTKILYLCFEEFAFLRFGSITCLSNFSKHCF